MFNFQPFQSPDLFCSKHFESWGEAPSGPSTGSSAATSTSEVPRSDVDGNLQVDSRLELRVIRFSRRRERPQRTRLSAKAKPFRSSSSLACRASGVKGQTWRVKYGRVSRAWCIYVESICIFHAFICSCLLNISCESCWVWYETPWLAVSSYVGNWGLRSGDDWELGSWQPYNPELPDSIWNVPPGTDVSGLPC